MNIAAYTGGRLDPSARARVRQFIAPLSERGIMVTEYPLPYGVRMPESRILVPPWAIATIGRRILSLAVGRSADASWICRQLLPAYIPLESLAKKPIVLDVDDAIWLNRGGHRVPALARSAHTVVCGNDFLAHRFSNWNPNIVVIPTAIDTALFQSGNAAGEGPEGVVIGWTGTSSNFPYLHSIEDALVQILDRYRTVKLLVTADKAPLLTKLSAPRFEFVRWTPSAEHAALNRMSIGIMPLDDSEWARGKCSYKMLCYMAASLPVVVSPVGMNAEILARGEVGLSSSTPDEWVTALSTLIESQSMRVAMGSTGRSVVEAEYSVSSLAQRQASVFARISA